MAKPLIDLSKFHKVSEDDNRAVLQHEAGHQIHIAKPALSRDMLKQLAALPLHQAEGTKSEDAYDADDSRMDGQTVAPTGGPQILPAAPAPGPGLPGGPFAVAEDAYATPRQEMLESNPATASPANPAFPPPASAAPQAPADPDADIKAMKGGPELLQANKLQTSAAQQLAGQQADIAHMARVQDEAAQHQLERSLAEKQTEIDAATDDIRKGHINPNAYFENKSVPSKIATAIGLVLGGISSGQTGQPNPALAFLQAQTERDIAAQKANLDNKHNLLSALQHQYGDTVTAEHMFRAIRANQTAEQLAEATAKAGSPMAKAAGMQAYGLLKQQASQYAQLANLNGLKASLFGGQLPPEEADAHANAYLRAARVIDPKGAEEVQKQYVPGVGVAKVPLSEKNRQELLDKTEMMNALQEARNYLESHKGFGAIPGTADYAKGQAIQARFQLAQGKFSDINRYTPEVAKIYKIANPDLTGTHFTGQDPAKLGVLEDYNNNSLNTLFQQLGINRKAGRRPKAK